MASCEHKDFRADVSVHRLEDTKQFQVNVKIECSQCHLPFQFLGLPLGLDLGGAAMSADGQEARLAIAPVGSVPAAIRRRAAARIQVEDAQRPLNLRSHI